MKFILISLLGILFVGCTKEVTYDILDDMSKNNCRNIINAQERLSCENQDKSTYKDYKKYYESK